MALKKNAPGDGGREGGGGGAAGAAARSWRAARACVGPAVPRRRAPREFWRSCWVGEGLWGYQEGQMGQKLVRFGTRRDTRSRQDESIEVSEVGSKRPSLGGTGGHVVRWIGLIFRLLQRLAISIGELWERTTWGGAASEPFFTYFCDALRIFPDLFHGA
jgi:hypothetical protein